MKSFIYLFIYLSIYLFIYLFIYLLHISFKSRKTLPNCINYTIKEPFFVHMLTFYHAFFNYLSKISTSLLIQYKQYNAKKTC